MTKLSKFMFAAAAVALSSLTAQAGDTRITVQHGDGHVDNTNRFGVGIADVADALHENKVHSGKGLSREHKVGHDGRDLHREDLGLGHNEQHIDEGDLPVHEHGHEHEHDGAWDHGHGAWDHEHGAWDHEHDHAFPALDHGVDHVEHGIMHDLDEVPFGTGLEAHGHPHEHGHVLEAGHGLDNVDAEHMHPVDHHHGHH
ncbi:Uncharacterized protein PBTT_06342 [Plasmodiophora brassicae]